MGMLFSSYLVEFCQMKLILLCLFIFIKEFNLFAQVPKFDWAIQMNSNFLNESFCKTNDSKNVISAFFGRDKISFGFNQIDSISNKGDMINVCSQSENGNKLWHKTIIWLPNNINGELVLQDLEVDTLNQIYITGTYKGVIKFGLNWSDSITASTSYSSGFIAKLNSNGDLIWLKKMNCNRGINSLKMKINPFNKPTLIGYFRGTVDFDLGNGSYNSTTLSNKDKSFVVQYDENSTLQWVKTFGQDNDQCELYDLEFDTENNVVLVGTIDGNVDFDPSLKTQNLNLINNGLFVLKLNTDGDYLWVKHFKDNGNYNGWSESITINDSNDIVIGVNINGYFNTETDSFKLKEIASKENSTDILLICLNKDGNTKWYNHLGGDGNDYVFKLMYYKGNTWVAGDFQQTVDFNSDVPNSFLHNSNSLKSLYLLRLNSNGKVNWMEKIEGKTNNVFNDFYINNNQLIFIGRHYDSIYFDDGKLLFTKEINLYSNYILKYNITQNTSLKGDFEVAQTYLYPNPANHYIKIQNNTELSEYTIINSIGLVVDHGISNSSVIDISFLKTGLYYIKMNNKIYKFLKL